MKAKLRDKVEKGQYIVTLVIGEFSLGTQARHPERTGMVYSSVSQSEVHEAFPICF